MTLPSAAPMASISWVLALAPRSSMEPVPSSPWVAPFAVLVLAIALLPLAAPHFWDSNLRKLGLSAVLGLPVFFLYLGLRYPFLILIKGGVRAITVDFPDNFRSRSLLEHL